MTIDIPPGLQWVVSSIPKVIAGPLSVYALSSFYATRVPGASPISNWVLVILSILSLPISFVFRRSLLFQWHKVKARRLGAELPPCVEEESFNPFGTNIITALKKQFLNGYPGYQVRKWMDRHGDTIYARFPSPEDNRLLTSEPEHVKAILATQFESFDKGPLWFGIAKAFLGTGVFNADGDMWKFHRSITRPFFTKDRITHYDIFELRADDALRQAAARLSEGHPIDVQDLVARFTLDSATEFLFGIDVASLQAGLPYPPNSHVDNSTVMTNHPSTLFVEAFQEGQFLTSSRGNYGIDWPLKEFWKDKVKPLRRQMDVFLEPILAKALADRKNRDEKTAQGQEKLMEAETLLDHLVNQTQDMTILKDELVNLLVAGRDTTACLLTYAFYMLAEHPDVASRLRQEVLDTVGPTDRPNYEHIKEMKFMRAFINEVLRLYPPVPFDSRTSNKDTVLASKNGKRFFVPAGTRSIYCLWTMQRRTDLWGPDAGVFDPNRFLDERLHKYLTPNPFIFCPFNAGPRICLGQQFAYNEASFFLVRLLQQFSDFSLDTDAQPEATLPPSDWTAMGISEKVRPGTTLTLYVKGGLWGRMKKIEAL